jgi:hypothetical protein
MLPELSAAPDESARIPGDMVLSRAPGILALLFGTVLSWTVLSGPVLAGRVSVCANAGAAASSATVQTVPSNPACAMVHLLSAVVPGRLDGSPGVIWVNVRGDDGLRARRLAAPGSRTGHALPATLGWVILEAIGDLS